MDRGKGRKLMDILRYPHMTDFKLGYRLLTVELKEVAAVVGILVGENRKLERYRKAGTKSPSGEGLLSLLLERLERFQQRRK